MRRRELREGGRISTGSPQVSTATSSSQQCSRSWRIRAEIHHTGGVKEQQRLGNGLSDVDRVIPPADSGASSCAISASIWCGARPVRP